jgi:hypothetical protein
MDRKRGLLVMLVMFVPLTVVATVASPGDRVLTALAMTVAFTAVVIVVLGLWDHRPSWWGIDLDPEERRLVSAAVRSGEALGDPRLARVASTVAGRTARAMWFMIAAGAVNLLIRLGFLLGGGDGRSLILDVLAAGAWVAYLAFWINLMARARRAEAANLTSRFGCS